MKRGSLEQLCLGAVVSGGFAVLSVRMQPYQQAFDNRFKIATDIAATITFNVCVLLSPAANITQEQSVVPQWILGWILIAINFVLPVALTVDVGIRLHYRHTAKLQDEQDERNKQSQASLEVNPMVFSHSHDGGNAESSKGTAEQDVSSQNAVKETDEGDRSVGE